MKKIRVLFFVLIISLLILQIISAAEGLEGVEQGLDEQLEGLETAEEKIDSLREGKWDYLGKEWSKILLKTKAVAFINGFFTKISFVFVVFFGEPYSFSLSLLFIILLWVYFFFKFREIFKCTSMFSPWVSNIVALGLTMVLAQITVIRKIIEFFGRLVFSADVAWIRGLIFTAILVALIFLARFSTEILKRHKKNKENMDKALFGIERSFLHKFVEILQGVFKND